MKISKTGKIAIAIGGAVVLILIARKVVKGSGLKKPVLPDAETSTGGSTSTNTTTYVGGGGDSFPLKKGSSGGNVVVLQNKINNKVASMASNAIQKGVIELKLKDEGLTLADFPIGTDGQFGSTTEKALKAISQGKTTIDEVGLAIL